MPLSDGFYPLSRAWMLGAIERNGDVFVTEPYRDAFTGGWLISVTKAIYNPDRSLRAVIGIDYYLSFFF